MAISFLVSVAKQGSSTGGVTTAIDTTGCDLLVANVFWSNGGNPSPTVSDSKGNTWTPATKYNASDAGNRFHYSKPTSVGASHTFEVAGTFTFGGIIVLGFSGVKVSSPLDGTNGANSASASSLATGSLTPSEDNCLLIYGCTTAGSINSVDVGTLQETAAGISSVTYGGGVGYEIQTTATARNPSFSASVTNQMAASILSFKSEPAAGGQPTVKRFGGIPGMAINRGVW